MQGCDERDRLGLFRRGFERMRSNGDVHTIEDSPDDRESLRLEVMLLREEVARLRTERHRPADIGTLIDQLRELAAENGEAEMEDEVWSLLAKVTVIREGLEQACIELESATAALRRRLRGLSVQLDQNGLGPDPAANRLRAPGNPDRPNPSTPAAWHPAGHLCAST
jgi:hypothetical protein